MKRIINVFCACMMVATLAAQDFNQYKPLECKGIIPKEYITSSADKYKKEIEKIEEKDLQRKEEKNRKQFALETNFVLDDLLQSGLVLFNDEVSIYLNDVMAKLLEQSPKLGNDKEKIKVYALRSTAVNAFATDRGHIFVTLGMLAQLENEAQLAYVLSHELVHAESGHALELFLETKNLDRNSRNQVLSESVFDEKWVARCNYSKELETEADKKGLERFLKTNYSTATLNTVFDVLKYSYLPFDDVAFDQHYFESDNYLMPKEYWLEKVQAISGEQEDSDDKASTHPNIAARRKTLNNALNGLNDQGRTNYLVSEERFKQLRQMTRFELPMLHLHHEEWPDAIYTSYLLLKQFPESSYLQKCMVKALYMHAKMKANDNKNESVASHSDIEGESQQVYHLLEKLPGEESVVLALRNAYILKNKYPNDTELSTITDDLFVELAGFHNSLDGFRNKSSKLAEPQQPVAQTDTTSQKELSKYDKIRQQKAEEKMPGGSEYWRFAFADFLDDAAFQEGFEKGTKEAKERREWEEYVDSYKGRRELRKEAARREKKGYQLGIDKVVVVNPYFLQLDVRKDEAVQYIRTELGQENMRHLIEEVVPKTNLDVTVLDVCNLKDKQVEQFNDIRHLNEWFSEQVGRFDMTLTPGQDQAAVDAIAQKYGTDYFLWTGTVSIRERNNAGLSIFYGLILYPTLPYFIYKAVKPNYDMLHYAILFDVKTGKRQVLKFDVFDKKDSDGLVKAHLYDTFSQIKMKGKKA